MPDDRDDSDEVLSPDEAALLVLTRRKLQKIKGNLTDTESAEAEREELEKAHQPDVLSRIATSSDKVGRVAAAGNKIMQAIASISKWLGGD